VREQGDDLAAVRTSKKHRCALGDIKNNSMRNNIDIKGEPRISSSLVSETLRVVD
jgi:hypothetical protein